MNAQLSHDLAQRELLVSQLQARNDQLEARHQTLQRELEQTKAQAVSAQAELGRLQQQTAQLATEVRWFTQNLGDLKQVYLRVRTEREQLQTHLRLLEEQRTVLEERFKSIPELRKAIQKAQQAQAYRLREERRQWIEALREADRRELERGNRGYIIQAGQPTLTSARLSIRVHTPEPTDTPSP